jgi:sugar O-acyltransferase (sialic acid O-acetyltransferase NeuD family)
LKAREAFVASAVITGEAAEVSLASVPPKAVLVLGHGGFAREVSEVLSEGIEEARTFGGFIAPDGDVRSGAGDRIVGTDSELLAASASFDLVVGVGQPRVRASILAKFSIVPATSWINVIHNLATVSSSCRMSAVSVFVGAGAVVSTDVVVGDCVLINWNSTIGHDALVGACCVVYPGANVGGFARLGEEALIGSGAQVLPGVSIGARAVVGAGAVVTHDVPDDVVVVGNPAKILVR